MNHGIVDVFAYQEALLIEAIFGIALLTMLWIGFRRWLQHKERMGRLIADQTAERAARYGAHVESVEGRVKALEQIVTSNAETGAPETKPLPSRARCGTKPRRTPSGP